MREIVYSVWRGGGRSQACTGTEPVSAYSHVGEKLIPTLCQKTFHPISKTVYNSYTAF